MTECYAKFFKEHSLILIGPDGKPVPKARPIGVPWHWVACMQAYSPPPRKTVGQAIQAASGPPSHIEAALVAHIQATARKPAPTHSVVNDTEWIRLVDALCVAAGDALQCGRDFGTGQAVDTAGAALTRYVDALLATRSAM